jgi:hypothetical protein
VVRWFTADGKPADPANPQLQEQLRRSLEAALRRIPEGRAA